MIIKLEMSMKEATEHLLTVLPQLDETTQMAVKKVLSELSPTEWLDDLIGEEWRDVAGFEGRYQVSNLGRVKSFMKRNAHLLHLNYDSRTGYYYVSLVMKNGEHKNMSIHSLVATAFIPNPENKPTIDHLDRNRKNNRVYNLRWATYHEQVETQKRHGTFKLKADNGANFREILTDDEVRQIREMYKFGVKGYGATAIGQMFGVSKTTILRLVKGKTYQRVK